MHKTKFDSQTLTLKNTKIYEREHFLNSSFEEGHDQNFAPKIFRHNLI